MTETKAPPRQRRSSREVRELLLGAAGDPFRSQGYDTTTTRQIAERAGVSEPRLFKHFGTKHQLFEAAMLAPFAQLIDDYTASWRAGVDGRSVEEILRGF